MKYFIYITVSPDSNAQGMTPFAITVNNSIPPTRPAPNVGQPNMNGALPIQNTPSQSPQTAQPQSSQRSNNQRQSNNTEEEALPMG